MSTPVSIVHARVPHGSSANAQANRNAPAGHSFAATLQSVVRAIEMSVASPGHASGLASPMAAAVELQARVYRDAERVELASKLLDHGIGAVKTVLQTRV